jgi:TfoX/Sxy family transcriptional regulator of competence genes
MKFVAAPPELVALFNAVLPIDQLHRIEPRKVFGYPCCFTGGHMFMGLFQDRMMLRLSPEDRAELIAKGGSVFEPTPGRQMKEYVTVPASVLENQTALRDWVHRSLTYGTSLPPKGNDESERPPKTTDGDDA